MKPKKIELEESVYLKHAEESLEFTIKVTRLFGLAPFAYAKSGKVTVFSYSRELGIYSAFVSVVVGICSTVGALDDLLEVDELTIRFIGTTTIYVTLIDFFGIIYAVFVDTYDILSKRRLFLCNVSYFNKIDLLLAKKYHTPKYHYAKLMFVTITLSSILYTVDGVLWYQNTWQHATKYGILKFLPFYVAYELATVLILQYWIMVDSIRRRLVLLKTELEQMGKQLSKTKSADCKENKVFRYTEDKRDFDCKIIVRKIARLLTAYQCAFKAVHNLNRIYGLPVVIFFFNVLVHEVTILYYFLQEILYNHKVNTIFITAVWIICYFYTFVLTVNGPHDVILECEHISASVAELLTYELDETIRNQLNSFSTALKKQPIKFSARGLMDIDRKKITSMAAVITTYIVVLMQFSVTHHTSK